MTRSLPLVTQYDSVLEEIEDQRLLNASYAGNTVAEVCNGSVSIGDLVLNDCQVMPS